MGLLDTSFSAVNGAKPRKSDRVMPGEELNLRGLLDAATNIPVAGDLLSGGLAVVDYAKGDKVGAAINAAAMLPFVSGTFIGKGAKTWDAVKAAEAEKRIKAGDDAAKVWKETGYGKAPWDNGLRGEIADNTMRVGSGAIGHKFENPLHQLQVGSAIKHPQLSNAYPDSMNISLGVKKGNGGEYLRASPHDVEQIRLGINSDYDQTAIHELQHAIQQREGWARGGSAEMFAGGEKAARKELDVIANAQTARNRIEMLGEDPEKAIQFVSKNSNVPAEKIRHFITAYPGEELDSVYKSARKAVDESNPHERYKRLAGEAEARLTQHRMNLTPEERLAQYPYDPAYFKQATGVDINDLIVRGLLE